MMKRLIQSHEDNPDFHHVVISLTDIGVVGQQLRAHRIEVKTMNVSNAFDMFFILRRLVKHIRKINPDIVQTWMYHADLLGGIAARLAGKRNVIWGIRSTNIRAGGSRSTLVIRKLCAWMSYCIPRKIICAAEASRQVHVALGYDAGRMLVVPNGFDLQNLNATDEQRQALRLSCGFTPDSIVIGSLGRFSPLKDHETFVRAAGKLAEKYPYLNFLLVGRDLISENMELSEWINQTGYVERFVLLGERSDAPVCLSAMDIFCLHSRTEGFPNVLGEAMAMRMPCVATDVGDAALLLGDAGMVVVKEDPVALAKGMEKLLQLTPEERASLGQKAMQRIHDSFTLTRTRERFEAVYYTMLNGSDC